MSLHVWSAEKNPTGLLELFCRLACAVHSASDFLGFLLLVLFVLSNTDGCAACGPRELAVTEPFSLTQVIRASKLPPTRVEVTLALHLATLTSSLVSGAPCSDFWCAFR